MISLLLAISAPQVVPLEELKVKVPFGLQRSIQAGAPGIAVSIYDELRVYNWKGELIFQDDQLGKDPCGVRSDGSILLSATVPDAIFNSTGEIEYSKLDKTRHMYFGYASVEFQPTTIKVRWLDSVEFTLPPDRNHVFPDSKSRIAFSSVKVDESPNWFYKYNGINQFESKIYVQDADGKLLRRISNEICLINSNQVGLYVDTATYSKKELGGIVKLQECKEEMPDHFQEGVFVIVNATTGICKPLFRTMIETPTIDGRRRMYAWQNSVSCYQNKLAVLGYDELLVVNLPKE